MKLQLGVIFGGQSVEHEVSILSAMQLMKEINKEEVDVIPIYFSKEKRFYIGKDSEQLKIYRDLTNIKHRLNEVNWIKKNQQVCLQSSHLFKKPIPIDLVLPITHGNSGEDGKLQGFLDTLDIPYCEGSVLSCALIQDKDMMRKVLSYHDLKVTNSFTLYKNEFLSDASLLIKQSELITGPWILKPAHGGSSIGIVCCDSIEELSQSALTCFSFDHKIVVEHRCTNFREFNLALLGDEDCVTCSLIEEVFKSKEFLSYSDKYGGSYSKGIESTSRQLPAQIDDELRIQIEEMGKAAFMACECNGITRVDFLFDLDDEVLYINEINAIPGSLATYLFKGQLTKTQIITQLIQLAFKKQRVALKEVRTIETTILKNENALGIKK